MNTETGYREVPARDPKNEGLLCMRQCEDAIDRAARYAQWGRRYKHLADGELGRRWAEAFRATVSQPDSHSIRLAEEDLFAEHQLRRIRPPYEEVSTARARLISELTSKLKELDQQELAALRTERARSFEYSACEKH